MSEENGKSKYSNKVKNLLTEAIRRRDAELLEKVERFKNEIVLSPDIADKTKWNVLEWVIKLIKGE